MCASNFAGLATGSPFTYKCSTFPFPQFLEVESPITPRSSISDKAQSFNTMRLFDYDGRDRANLCIAQEVTPELRSFSKISKGLDAEEEPAKRAVIVEKDDRKGTKRSLRKHNLQLKVIAIDDIGGHQNQTKHSSEMKPLLHTSKKS